MTEAQRIINAVADMPRKPSFVVLSLTRSELVAQLTIAHAMGQAAVHMHDVSDMDLARTWAEAQLATMERLGTYDPPEAPA